MPEDGETLRGLVERVAFHNPDNGFSVLRVRIDGRREPATVIGTVPSVHPGEHVEAEGRWIRHPQHGHQFETRIVRLVPPQSEAAIERYLASGLIDGIGPVYARKLVERFGAGVLDIIANESKRLEEVPGVGPKRRREIRDSYLRKMALHGIMVFLHEHGISTSRAVRIHNTYGDEALELLRRNPYQLAEDIHGIGFATADQIAGQLGIEPHAPQRLRAALMHNLNSAADRGHVYLPRAELLAQTAELTGADASLLAPALRELVKCRQLVVETDEPAQDAAKPSDPGVDPPDPADSPAGDPGEPAERATDRLFPPHLLQAERDISAVLRRLGHGAARYPDILVDKAIAWVQQQTGKTLAEGQEAAVRAALERRALIITGGPGTGKTTVLNSILRILEAKGIQPVLAAPTGRAARRLEETTGHRALTLHRLLEFQPGAGFGRHRDRPLKGTLFVIDEVSMVDTELLGHFVRALPAGAHLLLVGDADQLPSVGPGAVLADLLASAAVPVVRLTEVYRQAARSWIVRAAHAIQSGRLPEFPGAGVEADCFFIERHEPADIVDALHKVVTDRLPAHFGLDPRHDIQLLTPMHRGPLGATELNRKLQDWLNPPRPEAGEIERGSHRFRPGDRVMQTRNNYDLDLSNGDIGFITDLRTEPMELRVRFDGGRLMTIEPEALEDLQPAYAITIHKSQGSEFSAVVMPVHQQHYVMLQRNLLYTGLTRGRRVVVLIGTRDALQLAIRRAEAARRHTGLAARLR